jgi:hypothetical protein
LQRLIGHRSREASIAEAAGGAWFPALRDFPITLDKVLPGLPLMNVSIVQQIERQSAKPLVTGD